MAKNLTITISEELNLRLKKVRKGFKISKICQKAIEQEIIIKELLEKTEKDESAIHRLREEKKKWGQSYINEGQKIGLNAPKEINYSDYYIIYQEFNNVLSENIDPSDINKILKKSGCLDKCETIIKEMLLIDNINRVVRDLYLKGLIIGLVQFWEKIKDKV